MKHPVIAALALLVFGTAWPTFAQPTKNFTVESAVERALEMGWEVAESKAAVDAAKSAHRAAKALYGPRLMIDAKALYFNERPSFDLDFISTSDQGGVPLWLEQVFSSLIPEGPIEAGEQYNVDFRVTIAQPLTKLQAIAELSKVRDLDVQIAEINSEKTESELAYQVREASFQLLSLQATILTLEETEQEILAREKQIKAFRQAELVGPEEVLEVGVKLIEVRQGLIKARAYESVGKSRIRSLLRLESDVAIAIDDPGPPPPLPDLAESIERARKNRPELDKLRLINEQAEIGIRAKIQEYVPDVSLIATYQYQAGSSIETPELAVGAVMSWTPFAWGETYHAVREAKAKARQAQYALKRVESLIDLDVERNYAAAKAQRESISVAEAQVAQAEELYRVEQARFEVQHKTATDLLAAQTSLLRARSTLTRAQYEYFIALAALRKAMGDI